jgi:glycolate dehydrogenase iron-sulfur subunit
MPFTPLDPRTYDRALACVHCGLCLPACPTYTQSGLEADSPRGRIQLMRGLSDGVIEPTESVRRHLDLCLDCRGCETACPSGVVYHELIEETRERLAATQTRTHTDRLLRWMFFNVMIHPTRLKFAMLPAHLFRATGLDLLLPRRLRKMVEMLPPKTPLWPKKLPSKSTPSVKSKSQTTIAKVGFFPACVGSVIYDKINRQAIELLTASGCEVIVPPTQGCCGAIHHHNGEDARAFAKNNIDAFAEADTVVTLIAGCGAMLHEYDHLLRDDPAYAQKAIEFSRKVKDISVYLSQLDLPPLKHRVDMTVTYHDACHLAHAQKVTSAPRELLAKIPGLKIVPLPESDICCGAAGTYNLSQPEMAAELAERKLNNIKTTGATICVTGNVGCAMQIQSHAQLRGVKLKVVHPVELLHRAMFGL